MLSTVDHRLTIGHHRNASHSKVAAVERTSVHVVDSITTEEVDLTEAEVSLSLQWMHVT